MRRIIGSLIGATALALAATPVCAEAKPARSEPVRIGSLSGAYLAARTAEVDNDLDGAVAYYTRALSFDPDDRSLQQSLMLALISRGSFDQALPYAEKLKTVAEVERFSRLALAVEALRRNDYQHAETYLKLALESDLDRLITGLMTGWAKLGGKDADGALSHVAQLEGPEWYGIFKSFHRALIAERAGRAAEAREAYEQTVANAAAGGAAPETYLRAAEAYARMLARAGDKAGALAALDKADAFATNRPSITALRRDIETGSTIAPLVSSIREGAAEVLLDLASALNRGGGETFVRLYLQYARALAPKVDAVLVQLGQVAEQQGNSEEAIEFYRQVPDNSPLKQVSELQLGLNLADLDRAEEAKQHLRALVEADPDDMRAYLALGSVYASKEEYAAAAELYDDAVERIAEPTRADWNVFYQRGIAYERLKEWDKAEPNFHKALELFPDQPQVLNYLGYSWVDMNRNLEQGLELIRKAVDLRPNDGYIVDSLGWAYYRLGRYEDAVRELERAVSLKPDDPVLNDHLGDAYWRVGRRLEATFQWAHARDMKPDAAVLADVERKLANGLDAPVPEEKRAEAQIAPAPPQATAPQAAASDMPATAPKDGEKTQAIGAMPAAVPASYVVQPGESLWSIAVDVLGNGNRYPELLELNPELRRNPGVIAPGFKLRLPTRAP